MRWSFGLILLAFLGGMIGGLFYGLGQESQFHCGRCDGYFLSNTTISRIFSVLCVITYTAVVGAIAYGFWLAFTSHH